MLDGAPRLRLEPAFDGKYGFVLGRARGVESLIGPVSSRPCIAYRLTLFGCESDVWKEITREQQFASFELSTSEGDVHIDLASAELDLRPRLDTQQRRNFGDRRVLDRMLASVGARASEPNPNDPLSVVPYSQGYALRMVEYQLRNDEPVVAVGGLRRELGGSAQGYRSHGDRYALGPTSRLPIYLCNRANRLAALRRQG